MSARVHSFPPVSSRAARVLVLGSMPGRASLEAAQYYAYPRNAFWPIVGALFGFSGELSYDERCRELVRNRVALWDVLASCERRTSLDSDIDSSTIVPNDFAGFLGEHPGIGAVLFNGAKAEECYRRYVLRDLPMPLRELPLERLPSTSPAHAALSFDAKLSRWTRLAECAAG